MASDKGSITTSWTETETTTNTSEGTIGKVPFTTYDAGWVVRCIGMAIGAGIIFLSVQVGLTGLWVFAVSVLLAYPTLYMQ